MNRVCQSLFSFVVLGYLAKAAPSPQRLQAIAHGKPWTGTEQKIGERELQIYGTTGWQSYGNVDDDTEILKSELIITIETVDKPIQRC